MTPETTDISQIEKQKFLIIPCNAAGMGSVLRGAVSGLLFAEITGRTPLIYWHQNCNYLNAEASPFHNAFHDYFTRTCPFELQDVFEHCSSTYPQSTQLENLHAALDQQHENLNNTAQYFRDICSTPASQSDLIIFPSYISLQPILESIPPEHEFYKMGEDALTQLVAKKYLTTNKEVTERVENFWSRHFSSTDQVVTVHIRVGDKYRESILPSFSKYKHQVDIFLRKHPEGKIYLASDSSHAVDFFKKQYAGRVVTSPALRSSGRKGVHKTGADGLQIGNEILFDVECLSRGNHFIGFDESNVYFWVRHLTIHGIDASFSHTSVRSGLKEIFLNRQSFKRAAKRTWRNLFSQRKQGA